ncbi:MAG: hypothetical protein ACYDG5_08110 [Dehalococcoidales bacterium]
MLCIVRAKACKRCGGDLSIECDIYGVFIECIQCGATFSKTDLKLADFQKSGNNFSSPTVKPLSTTPKR